MKDLGREEIATALQALPHWQLQGSELVAEYTFSGFAPAVEFVSGVAAIAEELDHHPDIDIRFNHVRLAVFSHDVGRITSRDLRLAARVEELSSR